MTVPSRAPAAVATRAPALRRLLRTTALTACLTAAVPALGQSLPVPAVANDFGGATRLPSDPTVLALDLTNTNRVITWDSFNIGNGREVIFTASGPAPATAVVNRVTTIDPLNISRINGTLTATGISVFLSNPNGITFGPTGGFSGGSLILTTAAMAGFATDLTVGSTAAITLAAGAGQINSTGAVIAVAQTVDSAKPITATGDVALIAATDVAIPAAFGSPLAFTIRRGTTLGTARVNASGNITAANVRLYGARDTVATTATDALLSVGSAATLTATAVGGKVVLVAGPDAGGAAPANSDLTFAAVAPTDIDERGNIAQAGSLIATGAGGSVLVAARGALTGGGDVSAATGTVTLAAADTFGIAVDDITAANSFTLSHAGSLSIGDITVSNGAIDLATTAGAGSIATGALGAFDGVTVDAFTTANVPSAAAGVANPAARDVGITGVGNVTLGGSTATRDILLTSTAGNVGVTGDLSAGRTVTVDAAQVASVARGVTATAGNYTVDGAGVILGTADAIPTTQSARGFVRITADTTSVSGLGALTLRSNALGAGDGANARFLQLSALTDLSFAGTVLEGGTASQSVLALFAGGDITLGTARARRIVPVADFALPFSTAGDFTATDLTVAQDLSITSTAGSLRLGQATSTAGNVTLAADAGDITGLAGAVPAGPLDTAFGRANLTASAANRTITATAFGTAQLGTLTAGAGNGALAADQITVTAGSAGNPGAIAVDSAIARNGNARLTAIGGAVTLGAATVRGDLSVLADTLASVDGTLTIDGDYRATGQSVTLGGTQRAGGLVDITATSGPITGLAGLVLQSNRTGADDAANTRFLRLTATGDAIDFAATSQLLGGTTAQSALALNGTSALPADDATAIRLGIVRARTITGDLAGSSLTTAADIIGVDIVARDGLDLTSTAGAIRIGTATSQTGTLALTTTSADPLFGDITGLASGGGFGRATLTADAATGAIAVRAVGAAHLVQLGTVTAGTGVSPLALDQIRIEGGTVDVTQTIARNGGLLVQSTTADVILGIGSSARGIATILAETNARLGGLTSIAGLVDVRTATGDVTGLASGGGFARADLTASAADQSVLVTSAGAVTLGTLTAGQDVTVRAGSALPPSDGAIDLLAVTATNGDFLLDAVSADLAAPLRNGDVTLGTGLAGRDGTITASGDIRLGSALTTTSTGRTLSLTAGTIGLSTDSAAIVDGTITTGTASALGAYRVTGSRVELTGPAHSARAGVDLFAYGTGVADGITGGTGLTLTSNSANAAADNPLLLRANGGAGIAFAATSTLLGGANGISADIGIRDPLASLTLGTVRARSVQGFDALPPVFGSLTAPNTVTVVGDVTLANTVTVRGALSILSQTGDISTRAITVGTAAEGDRSLALTATTGEITANGALLAFGDVTLDAFGDVRLTSITTSPLPSATPSFGDIEITSQQGNITGLADPLAALAPFGIASLQSNGGVALTLPDNASIDAIDAQGLIDLDGANIRLGSATSRGGAIDITTTGALTGTAGSFGGFGIVTADLSARGAIRVTAGGVGQPQAVNLRDLTAGTDITVDADRIALRSATATSGTLTLIAGSTLALGTGVARDLITISGTGATTAPAITPDSANGVLDTNFGAANLLADADTGTIAVSAGTIAQLGTVRAGTLASVGNATQIDLSAGALTVGTLDARNGDILATTDGTLAPPFGSPLYIGTIAAANGVTVQKLGNTGLIQDELRIGRIESGLAGGGAAGNVLLDSDASIRLGSIMNAALGSFTASAATDITGLILPAPVGTAPNPPAPAFALLGITADRDIVLDAGNDFQAATLDAGRDIDATAGNVAWIGGDAIARGGHYRVTGASVLLGTPGGATQSAGTDVAIRSTAGDINGGSGLQLTSDRPNSGAATSYLVLDSAAGIAFANGLNGDTVSTLRGGADGTSADIGIRLAPAATLQLGTVLARSIGSASGPAGVPPIYTVAPVLTTGGAISARDITVANDLVIDNFASGLDLTLDTAESLLGGINLATMGELKGREIFAPGSPGFPNGFYDRTDLTAALGIETLSGFALFGTVDAGTGVLLATGSARLDATSVIARGGDAVLDSASHLRVDTVTATGDGLGTTFAQMLLKPALPQAALTTAGDISASAVRDVTDTALGGSAAFASTTGGVRIESTATLAGEGVILADQVDASGTQASHRDVSVIGRRILIGESARSAGGDVTLAATQVGAAQTDVSVTAPLVVALGTATISAGFGTAAAPAIDNGSLRLRAVVADAITLAALDGDITGLAGVSDSLDPGHARTNLIGSGAISARSGGLTLASVVTGADVSVEAGDVTQAGVIANNGAIDITGITAAGALMLTARAATATGGFAGDIRIGATAAAQPADGIAPTTAGGTATLTTSGVRGDIVIASGLDTVGNLALDSIANARLAGNDIAPLATHILRSTGGSVSATAIGDLTGLALPAPVGTAPNPPAPAFGLIDITAATAISLSAGSDLQAATLLAGTDIDATAGGFAWLGGTIFATAGHYRVTGGTVLLGTPGNAVQTAATDVAIRSTVGGIFGGSGLLLTSDSGNTGLASRYLVLDSAAGITFANGLNGDTISTIRGGSNGTSADIGIRLAPGATLQLGTVLARTIGSATGPAGVPPLYTIAPPLTTGGAIDVRDITVAGDLMIDNFASGFDLTLDTARSLGGGINLSTSGELKGREIFAPGSPGFPAGFYDRTDLTAALGIETLSGFALLGTVDAGTGISLTTGSARLDATEVIARGGDLLLDSASHLRVDTVTATGDGLGGGTARMLLNAALPQASLTTAGDIAAFAGRDVTDTALGGSATFVSTTGGVRIESFATAAGEGAILADRVSASGANAGHRDVAITGRRIAIGTSVVSGGGGVSLTATETGAAQSDVSITVPLVQALGNATLTTGAGTAATPGIDNGSIRVGSVNIGGGSITLTALGGNITGLAGLSDSLDPAFDRTVLSAGGNVTTRSGGLTLANTVTGIEILMEGGTATRPGALDVTQIAATAALTLTARDGDIRLGATAIGQPTSGATATTAGTTATLTTSGTSGDIVIASALESGGNISLTSIANARLPGGVPGASIRSIGGNIANIAGGDITGLQLPGTPGTTLTDYARADFTTGTAGTITLTAGGTAQLGTLTAGTPGLPDIADQITITAGTIDLTTATANNGNLRLTSTLGNVLLGTGDARIDATIAAAANAQIDTLTARAGSIALTTMSGDVVLGTGTAGINAGVGAAANARIGTLTAQAGNIAITAGADVSGLATGTTFGRADLITGNGTSGVGTITVTAATGALSLGTVTAGTLGQPDVADQIIASAEAIDITSATANNGNLSLTSTLGDVLLGTGDARIDATIAAAVNAQIDTLTARTGSIALTTTRGDVVLGTGTAGINAGVGAAANARIGTLTAQSGNIAITAGADVSGLATGTGFGRADLITGDGTAGTGTIAITAANGALSLGTVTAGTLGQPDGADQIVASAQAIDITTATANNGSLRLTSTLGDVLLGTGDARIDATIAAAVNAQIDTLTARAGSIALTTTSGDVILGTGTAGVNASVGAAANARIGTLTAQSGNIAITAGADVSGLSVGTTFGRADLTTGTGTSGVGTINVTAATGALSLGTVTAGTADLSDVADQIIASAQAIDITTATANNGNLSLTSTLGDVLLGTGDARIDATIAAAANAQIDTLTARTGNIAAMTTSGDVILGTGTAGVNASVGAAADARIGALTAQSGNIAITAGSDVSGLATGTGFGRADLITGDGTAGTGTINVTAATGALSLGTVTAGTAGQPNVGDQIIATARAIDLATATARNGNLRLTSTIGDVLLGTGDARIDATIRAAVDARISALAARTGSISVTTTRGDVVLGIGTAGINAGVGTAANARIGTLTAQAGNIAITAGADVSGLATGTTFGRADLTTGTGTSGVGTINVTAATGALSLGTVTAGTAGQPNVGDQITATARAIDLATATARNGNLRLTSTIGDVRLGTGDARIDATIRAAVDARISALVARTGSISVTTTRGDVVLGTGTAGINAGVGAAANARIGTLIAQSGNIAVTTTSGDVILATSTAGVNASLGAAANARIGTLTAQAGNIAITAGADVSGLATGTTFGRADLTTGTGTSGVGTINVTAATGALSLGTVTAGTTGQPNVGDQITATARAIDLTTATARNGNLRLTSTIGDVLLGTGDARIDATIRAAVDARISGLAARTGSVSVTTTRGDVVLGIGTAGTNAGVGAAANARIGTLTAQAGNIAITAGADVSGLATGTTFGRADMITGTGTSGVGTINVTAATGALSLGTVTAGTAGQPDSADQITATAEAIDITAATARNGNLSLTSTLGNVALGTSDARGTATIAAATNAEIGSLTTRTGRISATAAQGAIRLATGLAATDATITAATDVAIGTLTAQTGAIAITATAGTIAGNPGGGANLATLTSGRTIALTANTGTATLGTVDTVDGAITLTARDAALTGVVNADSATITILRGTGATSTRIGTFVSAATTPALTLDDAEMGRLAADTVVIGSGTDASDIAIGGLSLGTATGDKSLKFLGTGTITLAGAITDAGAVARTLQIGGDATAIDATTATPLALPLARRIEATLGSGTSGASIAVPAATVDLRGARITFSDTTAVQGRDSIGSIATETNGLSDAAAAQIAADKLVSSSGSGLYRNNQSRNVFLKAKLLRVSYSGFALFQNTDPSLQGLGVELNLTTPAANGSSPVLELRSLGDTPANSFALFGTINGFVGRTAGLLPNTVLEFVDPARNVRITQSNSRVNGCVIGSPDRGCLITDAPPPTLRLFDQRQLQLFGVADDLTIPFEPSVGSSNEALIGDFTTTGGLIDPDCTVPDAPGCPTPGARP